MLKKFKKFIKEERLFSNRDYVLLAVSGGIDSVVMCELFHQAKFRFALAHCNFQLRGDESKRDEILVKKMAKKYKVPFFSKKFLTSGYAKTRKISIQMAARELRYEWFEKIRQEKQMNYIAIATQLDDQTETLLINIIRGTGISGLHGIMSKTEKVIRPLLFVTRREILEFAALENLHWNEDSSNFSDKYVRNKIRHSVIPVLREINPALEQTISDTIEKIRDAEEIYHQRIEEKRKEILTHTKTLGALINIKKLLELTPIRTYLYEFLKPFAFNETVVNEIVSGLHDQPGKKFLSEKFCLIKDRDSLIIKELNRTQESPEESIINMMTKRISSPVSLSFRTEEKKLEILKDNRYACLDYEKIKFPLILRQWKQGDSFVPLGMKGEKKISDFLIDKKIPSSEKEKFFVLVSFGQIVWVVGHRINERFKVNTRTKKMFIAQIVK